MDQHRVLNPFFYDPLLNWVLVGALYILAATLLVSFFTQRNRLALLLGLANGFLGLAYSVAGAAVLFFPGDITTQSWIINIFGEFITYISFTYFAVAVLYAQFPNIPLYYGLFVLGMGFFVGFTSSVFFQSPTPSGPGFDYHRTFITDITPAILASLIFLSLSEYFGKAIRQTRFRVGPTIMVLGIVMSTISMPLISPTGVPLLALVLQYASVLGVCLIIAGLWLSSWQKHHSNGKS